MTALVGSRSASSEGALPELAEVWWRPRASERTLRHTERLWLSCTLAHTVPFLAAAVLLAVLKPLLIPVSLLAVVHAWMIPELYAARGAKVLRARGRPAQAASAGTVSQRIALGLLGDLLDHPARALHARTGLVVQGGRLGWWVVGEAGAVLVRPGGRRVHCYCVRPTEAALPAADRTAHLLLALRADETGFATVANVAFCGARWRLARRLAPDARLALAAVEDSKTLRYASLRGSN